MKKQRKHLAEYIMAELLPKSPVLHKKDGAKSCVTTFIHKQLALSASASTSKLIYSGTITCLIRHSLLGTNNNSVGCAAPDVFVRLPKRAPLINRLLSVRHTVTTCSLQSLFT